MGLQESEILNNRKGEFVRTVDAMEKFLHQTKMDVSASDGMCMTHLNTRLFLQVHVTNVIEASQDYDQAVSAYLAVRSAVNEATKKDK